MSIDETSHAESPDHHRRDVLYLGTVAVGTVGTGAAVWPLIDSMNPAADVTALGTTEVDVSSMEPGQRISVTWQRSPVFIDRRTDAEIKRTRDDDTASLKDPEKDEDRVQRAEWLVVVGICTHLGCIPLGQHSGDPVGDWGGWFCPCHGSHYDLSGRVRKGPAPTNLVVPPYRFDSDEIIVIG